jgi:hypothetical protein
VTDQVLENPTSPYVELLHGMQLTSVAREALTAANADNDPGKTFRAGLLAYREYAIRQAKAELLNRSVVDASMIRGVLDTAWSLFLPQFQKVTGPMIAEAYIRAFHQVRSDQVPITLIYELADDHARRVGTYFNDTSTDAIVQGFNTFVNREVPKRAAIERVLDGYGMTPRQMSGYTSATMLHAGKVESASPRKLREKVKNYIAKSVADRLDVFQRQEAHNLDMQAQQVAWLWLSEKGHIPENTTKMWLTARDEKVCKICGPMHRKKVGVREKFTLPNGDELYVPGAHVNCRCEVRLQMNPFEVTTPEFDRFGKRYDPRQPRDKTGRWATTDQKRAELLNDIREPEALVLPGAVIHRTTQIAGYFAEPRFLTTPLKHRDLEMLRLAHGASAWSRAAVHVDRARQMSDPENEYYANKVKLGRTERGLATLIRHVDQAPASSPELYRGLSVPIEHLNTLQEGTSFELPLSSFSSNKGFSESFARKWGPMIARARAKREGTESHAEVHPVIFVLESRSRALNIAPLVSERQAEWITRGKFTIQKVEDDEGLTVVHLTQEQPVSKADWEEREHPRGHAGQFRTKPVTEERSIRDIALRDAIAAAKLAELREARLEASQRLGANKLQATSQLKGSKLKSQPLSAQKLDVTPLAAEKIQATPLQVVRLAPEQLAVVTEAVLASEAKLDAKPKQKAKASKVYLHPGVPIGKEVYRWGSPDEMEHPHADDRKVFIDEVDSDWVTDKDMVIAAAIEEVEERVHQEVERIMDEHPDRSSPDFAFIEDKATGDHFVVDQDDIRRAVESVAWGEYGEPDPNEPVPGYWLKGVTDHPADRKPMTFKQLQRRLRIDPSYFEQVIYKTSRGNDRQTEQLEEESRHGFERWKIWGALRVVKDNGPREQHSGIPIRWVEVDGEGSVETYDVDGDEGDD